jgi:hypothetical protein|tara:strand:- start:370 stop:543 length:174 start_codon:yes stop_codon:yes gene_type:complete
MSNNKIEFNDMTHEQVMSTIKEGLHHLTTIDLVSLHAEISKVQIEHSHKNEIEEEDG